VVSHLCNVTDKDARILRKKDESVFSDEILVSKSDVEEKNTLMSELKTRVEELKMANEYQLRLKDMFDVILCSLAFFRSFFALSISLSLLFSLSFSFFLFLSLFIYLFVYVLSYLFVIYNSILILNH
jgi:hypothetical protein